MRFWHALTVVLAALNYVFAVFDAIQGDYFNLALNLGAALWCTFVAVKYREKVMRDGTNC